MTRINCIPVEELHDRHLVAEYREVPRVFALAKKAWERGEKAGEGAPLKYTMGKGHVRFFYDKLYWLFLRQVYLIGEMKKRNFVVNHSNPFSLIKPLINLPMPKEWFKRWHPTEEDMAVNRSRIQERLDAMGVNKGI